MIQNPHDTGRPATGMGERIMAFLAVVAFCVVMLAVGWSIGALLLR